MRAIVILFPLLMLASAWAGCFAEPASDEPSDTDDPGLPQVGDPPVATLAVLVDGNLTIEDANGTIPARAGVNLTFDASSSTGSDLSFGWDFGDGTTAGTVPKGAKGSGNGSAGSNATSNTTSNSTAGPTDDPRLLQQPTQTTNAMSNATKPKGGNASDDSAVVVHVYEEPGNYTVTLYVVDAAGQSDTAEAELRVGIAPGTVMRTESRKFSDSRPCSATDGVVSPAKTSTFEWVLYANETDGTPSEVANVTITGGPADTKFIGPDGKEIAKGATIQAKGPFPAGKYKITATSNCAAGSTTARTHNLNAFATYVAT